MRSLLLVFCLCFTAFSCQDNHQDGIQSIKHSYRPGIDPRPEHRAPQDARESFAEAVIQSSDFIANPLGDIQPESPTSQNIRHLVISLAAFNKEYLLSASVIPQTGAPTSEGLQSRVVYFKRHHDRVFMMEATAGRVVTDDLPAQLILAEMPVVSQDNRSVTIDFNAGMSKAFVMGNWYASDYAGKEPAPEPYATVAVRTAFIEEIKVSNNGMQIRQIAQLDLSSIKKSALADLSPTMEVRYFLAPYHPNPSYLAKETSDFKWVGYFEVEPKLEKNSGRSVIHLSRFHVGTQPITYYYSANVPADYEEAVKEGILYWNKAFGSEVLRAAKAPEGVTAPSIDHHLVQWVPWDQAGFAYADALMDPRSGEIMRAQVYLTSAFAFGGRMRARQLLRVLQDAVARAEAHEHRLPKVGLNFTKHSQRCNYDLNHKLVQTLSQALASNADDATLKRISQDYVRLVTAHEIGHTLGLRHNFAASLASEVSLTERNRLFRDYLLTGNLGNLGDRLLMNSVMEYAVFSEDVMAGQSLLSRSKALDYDEEAIRWAYQGRALRKTPNLLFCTDSHADVFVDCNRFDAGARHLENARHDLVEMIENLPENLVETFISAKAPLIPSMTKPLEEVVLSPDRVVNTWMSTYKQMTKHFLADTRSVKIERRFPFISSLNEEEVLEARYDQLTQDLQALGGIEEVLFKWMPSLNLTDPDLAEKAMQALDRHLAKPDVVSGMGPGGAYTFSAADLAVIKQRAEDYFSYVEDYLLEARLEHLSKMTFEHEDSLGDLENRLASLAEAIIFEEESVTPPRVIDGVTLPVYWYGSKIRELGGDMLSGSRGAWDDFSVDQRKRIRNRFTTMLNSTLGTQFKDVRTADLPRGLRQWKMEQEKILGKL